MTLERQVMGDFMQGITAEENIKPLKITEVITWVNKNNITAPLLQSHVTSGLLRDHTSLSETKTDMIFEVLTCKTMGNQAVGYKNLKKVKSELAFRMYMYNTSYTQSLFHSNIILNQPQKYQQQQSKNKQQLHVPMGVTP